MKERIELRKVRDFGELISDTLVFIKENFKPLFKAIAVICGFFIVLNITSNVLMDSSTLAMVNSAKNFGTAPTSAPQFFDRYTSDYFIRAMFLLVSLLFSYISVYLTTYCYIVLYREKGNQPPSVEEVWGYFKFYFLRIFGSSILIAIILCLSLLLCLSGIYLIPAFSILLPIMVIENSSFSYAFNRSFKLVNNYWWQTFGVAFVIGLIVWFANLFLAIPGQILLTAQMMIAVQKSSMFVAIISGLLKSLIIFFYTLPATAYCLCYYSLVEAKEGTGLLDRIDMLGKDDLDNNIAAEEY